MNKLRLLLVLLALAALSGCGTEEFYTHKEPGFGPRLDFEQGTTTLHSSAPKISVNKTIGKARKLEKDSQWAKADEVYQEGLAQHGKSAKLKKSYREFKARRDYKLARLEVDAMITKAHWLKEQHRYRRATDASYRGEHWREAVRISKQLADKGLDAMERKQMNLAHHALSQSVKINSNRTTRRAYDHYRDYKERMDFARLVRKGRKMADISTEPGRLQ